MQKTLLSRAGTKSWEIESRSKCSSPGEISSSHEVITKVYIFVLTYVYQYQYHNRSVITNDYLLFIENTSHENTFNLKFLC